MKNKQKHPIGHRTLSAPRTTCHVAWCSHLSCADGTVNRRMFSSGTCTIRRLPHSCSQRWSRSSGAPHDTAEHSTNRPFFPSPLPLFFWVYFIFYFLFPGHANPSARQKARRRAADRDESDQRGRRAHHSFTQPRSRFHVQGVDGEGGVLFFLSTLHLGRLRPQQGRQPPPRRSGRQIATRVVPHECGLERRRKGRRKRRRQQQRRRGRRPSPCVGAWRVAAITVLEPDERITRRGGFSVRPSGGRHLHRRRRRRTESFHRTGRPQQLHVAPVLRIGRTSHGARIRRRGVIRVRLRLRLRRPPRR